jgi:hypothetical protein
VKAVQLAQYLQPQVIGAAHVAALPPQMLLLGKKLARVFVDHVELLAAFRVLHCRHGGTTQLADFRARLDVGPASAVMHDQLP